MEQIFVCSIFSYYLCNRNNKSRFNQFKNQFNYGDENNDIR